MPIIVQAIHVQYEYKEEDIDIDMFNLLHYIYYLSSEVGLDYRQLFQGFLSFFLSFFLYRLDSDVDTYQIGSNSIIIMRYITHIPSVFLFRSKSDKTLLKEKNSFPFFLIETFLSV